MFHHSKQSTIRLFWLVMLVSMMELFSAHFCWAEAINPLAPPDTSSPRETLTGFIKSMEARFEPAFGSDGLLNRYIESGQLFMDETLVQNTMQAMSRGKDRGRQFLDFSGLPEANKDQATWRICIQLKEVLDRIDLPAQDQIPDATHTRNGALKRWTIPETEIHIDYVETGPNAGAYLFSKETVRQIPYYYGLVKDLPYRATKTKGMYDLVFNRPSGLALFLRRIVPARWFFNFPDWAYVGFKDQPAWKWIFMLAVLGLGGVTFWVSLRLSAGSDKEPGVQGQMAKLLPPVLLLIMLPFIEFLLGEVLRVSLEIFNGLSLSLWGLYYLAFPWLVWELGGLASSWVIRSDHVNTQHVDAQLIRLGTRLLSLIVGGAILVEGASRLGLPAYSVVAGFGIGGLAIALAGQQALANLLGSLIIMIEKPFRVGHSIKAAGFEGKVEDIGFRSTRLRTPDNTLVIVPSVTLINTSIENLSLRKSWRIQRVFFLDQTTPPDDVRLLRDEVEQFLQGIEALSRDPIKVTVPQMGPQGFEFLVEVRTRSKNDIERTQLVQELVFGIVSIAASRHIAIAKA